MYGMVVVSDRAQSDDVRLVFAHGRQKSIRVDVDPQVDHFEAAALHHHGHQVLTDVVDISLDRADHHRPDWRGAGLGQQWPQERHPALHGFGRHQHFRHK